MHRGVLAVRAPAKINLFLRVTGRRADGYHTLETLMHKVGLFDLLEFRQGGEGLRLRCPGADLPEDGGNLVHRAAALFVQTAAQRLGGPLPGVEITLSKNIPVAAGLGGGSSDAAATLKGLNRLFDAGLGLRLGADVPFFVADAPAALAVGIGEILTPVSPLTGCSVLLVTPGFAVSTRWVYQTFALTKNRNAINLKNLQESAARLSWPGSAAAVKGLPASLRNDLESVTIARFPEVGRLKEELLARGAVAALMSGSGPTVFALFSDRQAAETCRALFARRFTQTFLVHPYAGETRRDTSGNVSR
jgi:4-diphosphocytidyl-2-C-methyl-D-erythritol kinase